MWYPLNMRLGCSQKLPGSFAEHPICGAVSQTWRWKHYAPSKRREKQAVTSRKIWIFYLSIYSQQSQMAPSLWIKSIKFWNWHHVRFALPLDNFERWSQRYQPYQACNHEHHETQQYLLDTCHPIGSSLAMEPTDVFSVRRCVIILLEHFVPKLAR